MLGTPFFRNQIKLVETLSESHRPELAERKHLPFDMSASGNET